MDEEKEYVYKRTLDMLRTQISILTLDLNLAHSQIEYMKSKEKEGIEKALKENENGEV